MATYQFSALADGQAISFNPNTDVLNFDNIGISGADISAVAEGSGLRISFGSQDVLLSNVSPLQVSTANITFANGSVVLFGDNSTGTANDNAANAWTGSAGNDQLVGFGGADTLSGGLGNDRYIVTAGDVLVDSGGIDTVVADINWTLGAAFENFTMTGTGNLQVQGNSLDNHAIGNSGNNYFNLRAGNDTIEGGAGNDTIDMSTGGTSSYGNDWIQGGDGIDTVDFDGYARSGVTANLGTREVRGGGAGAGEGSAILDSIERFIGGAFDDSIHGGAAAEYLDGRGGNDTLAGGAGNDTLIGGIGADSFLFDVAPGASNADQVTGFVSGSDRLVLDALVHSSIGGSGPLAAGDQRFWASTTGTAHDASDRVLYNTATGQIWYDADGNGSGAAQLIATLQGAPSLAATDISVVNGGSSIVGTNGNDSLVGTAGSDTIQGLGGNDTINGNGGADSIVGGDGDDRIQNGFSDDESAGDTLIGGNGNDTLDGTSGGNPTSGTRSADTLDGGLGDDYFNIDEGDVVLDAGGIDTIQVNDRDWTLGAGFENLIVKTDLSESPATGIGNALDNEMWLTFAGGRLEGLAGNDTLHAGSHESDLFGGDGDDLLIDKGRSGGVLDGGAGNDTLLGEGATLTGGAGADHFAPQGPETESSFFDTITDFTSGVDRLQIDGERFHSAGASGDFAFGDGRFYAAAGANEAHDASDRLIYNTSTGQLYYDQDGNGFVGAFLIATLQGAPSLSASDVYVTNGSSGSTINGTEGNDSIDGTAGDDTIHGLGGDDTLQGGLGADWLDGGSGNDSLNGGGREEFNSDAAAGDVFIGGDGNDTLDGWAGTNGDGVAETMDGGLGDDQYYVDMEGDVLSDSGGTDTVWVWDRNWTLGSGFENLQLVGLGGIYRVGIGNELDNYMEGGDFVRLEGRGGNDTLQADGRDNILLGDEGDDHVAGGDYNDTLEGGAGNDTLLGGWNTDVLSGGDGDDRLDGNGGFEGGFSDGDELTGGAGADSFAFTQRPDQFNASHILDFASGVDTLRLDGGVMTGLGASGRLAASDGRFYAAAGATSGHDADDRLVYNTATRELFYDADGSGSQQAFRLATLQPGATLAATDIVVDHGVGGGTINGTAGDDTLIGTVGNDTINGLGGNDSIEGRDGLDSLSGGDGNDTLWGADADHAILYDWEVPDTLDGGFGDDVYHVRGNDWDRFDTIVLDPGGIDTVHAHQTSWTLGANLENLVFHDYRGSSFHGTGNELDNVLDGGGADYVELHGMDGNDTLVAGYGGGTLYGEDGNDLLQGSVDHGGGVYGGAGNDTLSGRDYLDGGDGNDSLSGSDFEDMLDGGNGVDTMAGGGRDDVYYVTTGDIVAENADSGVDTVNAYASWTLGYNFENLTLLAGGVTANGNNLDNVLTGNDANNSSINGRAGNDTMFGMGGNDVFDMSTGGTSSYGSDVIDGGAGTDSVEFGNNARTAVNINLAAGTVGGGGDGGAGSATLTGIENALGGNFNDTLIGNGGANYFRGSNGNDTLNGGAGNDRLQGDAGNDSFVFDALGTGNSDTVIGFAGGADKLLMENAVMTAIGATGNFAAGDARFWSSTAGTAHDANDRIIYDTDSGQLWYDADGSGGGAAQLIATLQGNPALAATDVGII